MLAHPRTGALQGAVDRGHRRLEQLRRLLGRAVEDVAQDEHRPRQRRQVLDRGQEGELDGLLVDGRGLGLVRVGREPSSSSSGYGCSHVISPECPDAAGACRARRGRRSSRSCRARPARRTVRRTRACCATRAERLLHQVLAVVEGPEHPVAMHVQLATVALDLVGESGLVRGQAMVIGGDRHVSVTVLGGKTHRTSNQAWSRRRRSPCEPRRGAARRGCRSGLGRRAANITLEASSSARPEAMDRTCSLDACPLRRHGEQSPRPCGSPTVSVCLRSRGPPPEALQLRTRGGSPATLIPLRLRGWSDLARGQGGPWGAEHSIDALGSLARGRGSRHAAALHVRRPHAHHGPGSPGGGDRLPAELGLPLPPGRRAARAA